MRLAPALLLGLAITAALLVARAGSSPTSASQDLVKDLPHVLGDADCDGVVDAFDGLQVLRDISGIESAGCAALGNINCDPSLDAIDVLGILRSVAALTPPTSDGCPTIGTASMRLLTIDVFGEGIVSASSGATACSPSCSMVSLAVPDGSAVELAATPEPGSRFDHWSGCDSEAVGACSVTLDVDKTVLATFAFDEVIIPPTTKILDEGAMALLLRVEGDTYYFDPLAMTVAELKPGDVMVSGVGDGLLLRVTSVTVEADEIAVETEAASLEQTIEKGTIVIHQELAPIPQAQGSSGTTQPAAIADQINVGFQGGVGLSGSYSFRPYLDLAISFDGFDSSCLCYPLQEARVVLHMDLTADLNLVAQGGVSVSGEQTIWQQPLAPIIVPVGPVALVFIPELAVNAGVSVTAEAGFETGISLSTDVRAGVAYNRASGWRGLGELHRGTAFSPPHLTGSVEAKAYLAPEFALRLAGVVGPYVSVEGFGRIIAEPLDDPWWTLSAGLGASAGFSVEVPVFGEIAEFESVVLSAEWVVAEADSSPPTANPLLAFVGTDSNIWSRDSDILTRLTNDGGNSSPTWSPDARRIAFVHNGTSIHMMWRDGSGRTRVLDQADNPLYYPGSAFRPYTSVRNVRWTDDPCTILYHADYGSVGGQMIRSFSICDVVTNDGGGWSDDDDPGFFTRGFDVSPVDGTVVNAGVYDLQIIQNGVVIREFPPPPFAFLPAISKDGTLVAYGTLSEVVVVRSDGSGTVTTFNAKPYVKMSFFPGSTENSGVIAYSTTTGEILDFAWCSLLCTGGTPPLEGSDPAYSPFP